MGLWLTVYFVLNWYIFLALAQSTGHQFKIKSQTGLTDDRYLIGHAYSTSLECIIKCANFQLCHIVSYSDYGKCCLYSIHAYYQMDYSTNSTVFIKQTYLSEYISGVINYWIGSSDGFDVLSGANLFGGVNVVQISNRHDKPSSAFLFDYGYYRVPPGVYFNGDFSVSAWVKLTRYGHAQRLIDFGNSISDNVIISVSYFDTNQIGFLMRRSLDQRNLNSITELRIGVWEHLTVTLIGSTGYIYINGIFDVSGQLYMPNNILRSDNYIGRSSWPNFDPKVSAAMSNIKIFNKALNQSEIINNFNLN